MEFYDVFDVEVLRDYCFAEEESKEKGGVCSRKEPCLCCMDCLGLSWRDFI